MKKYYKLFFLTLIFLLFNQSLKAQTYVSNGSGDWNDSNTWTNIISGDLEVPVNASNVTIQPGHTVNVNAGDNFALSNLTVNGTLDFNVGASDRETNILNGNGTIKLINAGSSFNFLMVTGTNNFNITSGSTVIYESNMDAELPNIGSTSYQNLQLEGGVKFNLINNITVEETFTLADDTELDLSVSLITRNFNNVIFNNNSRITGGNDTFFFNVSGDMTFNGSSSNFDASDRIVFNGNSNQTISNASGDDISIPNAQVIVNKTGGTLSLSNNLDINNDFFLNQGTFDLSSHNLSVDRLIATNPTVKSLDMSNATIEIKNTSEVSPQIDFNTGDITTEINLITDASSTFEFTGNADIQIDPGESAKNLGNLLFSSASIGNFSFFNGSSSNTLTINSIENTVNNFFKVEARISNRPIIFGTINIAGTGDFGSSGVSNTYNGSVIIKGNDEGISSTSFSGNSTFNSDVSLNEDDNESIINFEGQVNFPNSSTSLSFGENSTISFQESSSSNNFEDVIFSNNCQVYFTGGVNSSFENITYNSSGGENSFIQFKEGQVYFITGTFTASSSGTPLKISSTSAGSSTSLSFASTQSWTRTEVQDIDAINPFENVNVSGGIDSGNNSSNIIFNPQTYYWAVAGGNWQDASSWSLTSGGLGGAGVPLANDNAVFDGNSTGGSITVNAASGGNEVQINNLSFSAGGGFGGNMVTLNADLIIKGDLTLDSEDYSYGGNFNFTLDGSGAQTFDPDNSSIPNLTIKNANVILNNDVSIDNNLLIESSFAIDDNDVIIDGDLNFTLNSSESISGTGSIIFSGNNDSEITVQGSGGTSINATISNISLQKTSPNDELLINTIGTTNLLINGQVQVITGVINTIDASMFPSGNISGSSNGIIRANNSVNFSSASFSDDALVVEFLGATSYTIAGTLNLPNVTISGSGTKTFSDDVEINGDLEITSGANLALTDTKTLTLRGNWNNQGMFTPNESTVLFTSDNSQTLSKNGDTESFYNIEINKSGNTVDLINDTDIEITNELTLTSGNFDIGNDNISTSSSGSISGGSASSYIITNGTGVLARENLGSGIHTFPIGTSNQYTPVTVSYATAPASDFTFARVGLPGTNGLTNASLGSNYINLIWSVTTPTLSDANNTIELNWVSPDNEVGTISDFTKVNKLNGSTWEVQNTDSFSAGSTMISATDISSFGEFAVFVPQANVNLTTVGPIAGNVIQGSSEVVLHETTVEVTNASTNLSAVQLSVGGSFTNSDFDNFQLILSQDNDITTTGDNTSLGTITNPSFGGLLNFTSLNQTIDVGIHTLFLVGDANASASIGSTIQTNSPTLSNFTFTNADVTGFVSAGEVQTVIGSPTLTTNATSNIITTSLDIEGEVTATGGVDITERGFIYYEFDGTDKVIGDAGVSQDSETGTFSTGVYTSNITGLTANTQYSIIAYATNEAGTSYGNRLDFRTLATEPTAQATSLVFSGTTETQIDGSFTPSSASNYLVLRKEDATITTLPEDANSYIVGSSLGDAVVVSTGTSTSFSDTGLNSGTTYFYTVFAYNGDAESANYLTTSPLASSETTLAPTPTITSINPTSVEAGGSDLAITVTGTNFNSNSKVQWNDGSTVTDLATIFNSPTELEATIISSLIANEATVNIQVSNPAPGGGISNQEAFTVIVPFPNIPVALSATNIGVSSFTANWGSVDFATSYLLDVSEDISFSTFILENESITSTSSDVTGLSTDATYFYRVRAVNSAGNSAYSNVVSVTTSSEDVINAPSNLSLDAFNSTEIDVFWTDNSDNEEAFELQRSLSASIGFTTIATLSANETFYTDNSPLIFPNTTYYYRIRATNSSNASEFSTIESITTPAIIPNAPSELDAITISSSQINLVWLDNSTNETGFSIERSEGILSGFIEVATVGADVISYEDTGLDNETLYYYRVRAIIGSVNSSYSNITGAVTSDIPLAASNLTVVNEGIDNVELSWQDNSTNETGFVVEVFTLIDGFFFEVLTTGQNETSAVISELSPNRTHLFRVKAINENGDSPYTNTVTAETLPDPSVPVPDAPSSLEANAVTQNEISLRWQDNSTNEETFKIDRRAEGEVGFTEIAEILGGTTRYNDIGLTANTVYFYRVRASNAGGNSLPSDTASARADCNLLVLVESETGGNTFCDGKDALLTANTNTEVGSYRWLKNGIPIPDANLPTYLASEEGKYTCEILSGGCREGSTPEFILIFEEGFDVNIELTDNNILEADLAGAEFYQWYYDFSPISGANGDSYMPTESGVYFVIVTDNGCSATSNSYDFGDITTSIEDLTLSNNLSVFPNPAQSLITLELDNDKVVGGYEIYLTDMNGKSVLLKQGEKTKILLNESLDISNFSQGIYLIEFRYKGRVGQKRVMKY